MLQTLATLSYSSYLHYGAPSQKVTELQKFSKVEKIIVVVLQAEVLFLNRGIFVISSLTFYADINQRSNRSLLFVKLRAKRMPSFHLESKQRKVSFNASQNLLVTVR